MKRATLEEATRANADLYVFNAVISMLEGASAPSMEHFDATQRIIKLCTAERQRAWKRMHKASEQLLVAEKGPAS